MVVATRAVQAVFGSFPKASLGKKNLISKPALSGIASNYVTIAFLVIFEEENLFVPSEKNFN